MTQRARGPSTASSSSSASSSSFPLPATPLNMPKRLPTSPKTATIRLQPQSRYTTSVSVSVPAWERSATLTDRPLDDIVGIYNESDPEPSPLFESVQEQDDQSDDAFVFSPASFGSPHTPSPLASAVHDHDQSYRRRSRELSRTPPYLRSSPLSASLHRSTAATPLEQYELDDEKDMEEFKNSQSHRRLSAEFNERKTRRSYELATEGWTGYNEKAQVETEREEPSPASPRYSQYHFNPYSTYNSYSHVLPPRRHAYASPHHDETDVFSDYNACDRASSPISSHPHELNEDDEIEEQLETYTPTCTDAIRMKWQAIALAWRFGVFRTKRRIRRRVGLST